MGIRLSLMLAWMLAVLAAAPASAQQAGHASTGLALHAPAFGDHQDIPVRYTCDGENISPALNWSGVPDGVKSFALVIDDPDAPDPKAPKRTWVHWVVYNLPAAVRGLERGAGAQDHPAGSDLGSNSWQRGHYGGPCPPIGKHRYFFKLYALDTRLRGLSHPSAAALRDAMQGHILARAQLVGLYRRH